MKRHPSLIPLSHDHRQILFLAQIMKRGIPRFKDVPTTAQEKRDYMLDCETNLLRAHFALEEEVIFPMVRGVDQTLDALIASLLTEHRQITARIEALQHTTDLETQLDELGYLPFARVLPEDSQLFQRMQAIIAEDVLQTLKQRIDANQTGGSICNM